MNGIRAAGVFVLELFVEFGVRVKIPEFYHVLAYAVM
jgi:hypothetical protein